MNPFDKGAELNNEKNLKIKSSICNHHSFDACVYVQNDNERIGMVIGLLLEGYYMLNCHISQIYDIVGINPLILIENGQIYPCGGPSKYSKKFDPNLCGAIEHDEWLKELKENLERHQASDEDIKLYLENPDVYQNQELDKWEAKYEWRPENMKFRPCINCGTNVKMFETVLMLRDDDTIYDSEKRKKLKIYDWHRVFTHNKFGGFDRYSNLQDFNPETDGKVNKPGYEDYFIKIATIYDILKEYKQGEIDL